jgi:NAD(P)-dependent dehydrogenase (short-subunit alcohol dehydrogenase family)
MGFEGQTAIVTSGGTGIGRATALALAREGASIVLGGLEQQPLRDVDAEIRALGAAAHVVAGDVRRAEYAEALVDAAVRTFGRLDVVVNSAGTSAVGDLALMSEATWDDVFGTNVKGVFLVCRAAIPHLVAAGGGAIVNVASQLAISAVGGFAAYCASKAAVVHLTRAVSLELIGRGVRVNCVCPGATDTPLLRRAFPGGHGPQGTLDDLIRSHPIDRLARPDEIAQAILFLASDRASFVVGEALVVDGGYVLP